MIQAHLRVIAIYVWLEIETILGFPVVALVSLRQHQLIAGVIDAVQRPGRPPLGTRLMYAMFSALEFVLPARTKTEHWPL